MIDSTKLSQEGGDKSVNIQAVRDVNVQMGVSFTEAKDIAMDVFKANALQMTKAAAELFFERANSFADNLLKKIADVEPSVLDSFSDPGMQHSVYSAQSSFAKSGDSNMQDILINILIERGKQKERSLEQIVLDETINTIPKLTTNQIDILTLIFMLSDVVYFEIIDEDTLREFLTTKIFPQIATVRSKHSEYKHLEFTGCASIAYADRPMEVKLGITYPALLNRGMDRAEFIAIMPENEEILKQCVAVNGNPDKIRFNCASIADVHKILADQAVPHEKRKQYIDLSNKHKMNKYELKELVNKIDGGEEFISAWEKSHISTLRLTSVGIAVAISNLRSMHPGSYDLSAWI